MGALKRFLIDDLLRERNKFARRVMKDIEQSKAETKGLPTRPQAPVLTQPSTPNLFDDLVPAR